MRKFVLIMAILSLLGGCADDPGKVTIRNTVKVDSHSADMCAYKWLQGECADFQQISVAESIRFIKDGGSGIVYYGFIGCPFCERAVPILNQAALEAGNTIYYVDVKAEPAATQEEYEELVSLLETTFNPDQKGNLTFFVPEVIGIKKGKITGYHVALVDGWTPIDEDDQMDDLQKTKLLDIYRNIIISAGG